MLRRLAGMVGAALAISLGTVALIARLGKSWDARVAVEGHSMEPTLLAGEWLLVDPDAFRHRSPRLGEMVVARDPVQRRSLIVKRVQSVNDDGRLLLAGDHPAHALDAQKLGPLDPDAVIGRPWFRYWPLDRAGGIS